MKKLLLTLLGASLLCGLSPHPLSAQETNSGNVLHMDFNKRADGHNEDLHFYGKLQELISSTTSAAATTCTFYEPETRFEWPTVAAGVTVSCTNATQNKAAYIYSYSAFPNYDAKTNYDGVKCIENDQLKLELNYRWALAKNFTYNSGKYKPHFTSQIRIADDEGALYLYPGVTFKITTKNGKKIKKITLKTPYNSTYFTPDRRKAALFVYKTPEGTDDFSSITSINTYSNSTTIQRTATVTDGTYEFTNGSNTINRATIEITLPETYPGENSEIVLGLKKDQIYPWNHTGTLPYKFAALTATSSSSSNINKLCEPFGISAIDIEYYGDEELPKYVRSVTCGIDNNDKVEIEQNGVFVDINTLTDLTVTEENREKIKISDATVKLRLGDAIVEITKSTTNNIGKPTVTFDKALNRVGVHAYATIKAYPDPEKYKYNGTAATPYKMTYLVHGKTPANKSTYAASESAKSMGYNLTLLQGQGITYTPINKDPEILSISTTSGIPNDVTLTVQSTGTWGAPDDPNENTAIRVNSVKLGTYPAFVFDGISFIVPSDTPNPPLKPTATTDLNEAALPGGVWHSARPFTLTLAPQTDDYDNHKIEYIISEEPIDEIDWTSAKEYTAPLSIEKSCYVYARTLSTYEGETFSSAVETVIASILNPIKIADLADLHKAENDGKLVMLQIPLMVRGNCKMNVQDASAPNKFTNVVYARDANGTAVKLISRRNATSDESFPSSLSYSTPTIDKINLVPVNTVVGKYHYNNGINPEIIIRDLTSDPADDYYAYQGKESSVQVNRSGGTSVITEYEGISFANAKATKLATDEEYTDITDPHSLLGKIVILRGLANWNAAENTFELSKSADKKTIKIRSGATVEGSLSAGSGHISTAWNPTLTGLSSDKEYSAIVAVEYDPTDQNYYFAPCEFYESFEKPELTIPEAEKDKYQVIRDENNNISEIIYTDEFLNGNISLSFSVTKPSALASTAYYFPALKREDGSAVVTPDNVNSNTFKLDFTTKQLTFDEETGAATVYASAYCKGNYNTTYDGHQLKITIRDAVQTGPEVVSIEEFRTKMQKGELSADKPVYVRFNGRFAVVARNGNVLQLRDVDKDLPLNPANASDTVTVFKDSYILVHENDGWKYTYLPNPQTNVKERTGFPVFYQSNGMYGWEAYAKKIAVGEEITQFIGKVTIDEAGNYDIDLTGLGNFFTSWALYLYQDDGRFENFDKLAVSGYKAGTPRFIPYMVSRDLDGNPVTDEQGNPVMREENCVNRPVTVALSTLEEHPENHPEKVELNDDLLDAQMKVMKVQVKKADDTDDYTALFTADGVALLWDMFGTDQVPAEPETEAVMALADEVDDTTAGDDTAEPAKSVKDQLADHLAAGTDHFDVTGILRKHTDGKYAIQVEQLIPTPVDSPARFFADGKEIEGDTYGFVKRIDLTTDTPEGAVIKMTVGDGEQEAYNPEKLKGIEADTKVSILRSTPGVLERTTPTTITLTKLSTDVNTLAEMAQGDNANDLYHFRKHLKVVAAAEGTVMAADAEGNLAVVEAAPAEAEEGQYLADIVLVRSGEHAASIHEIDADAALLDEADSYAIDAPAPATLFGATVAEGKATDAEGNIYTIDPTFVAIPEGDAEAWSLTGYILPGADDKPVIYLTASKAIDRVALPVITPAEAAFLDRTTFTIDCATTGAAIEYSLDGGKTWLPYNGDPVKVEATCEILARATAADMLPSHEAKASVVREYLSGDVTITVDEQEAVTTITISGPEGAAIHYSLDGATEKLYEKPIVITNDTQAEIRGTIKAYALESGKRPGNNAVSDYKVSFKQDVTGIGGVGADEAESVRVEGNTIIVPEGAQTFDIAGRRVNPTALPRGIYIVRLASGKAVKAVVK